MMNPGKKEIQEIIDSLEMKAHPEGGWYRQTWTAEGRIDAGNLPRHNGERPYATSIYFLLTADNFSAFHRLRSDEMWYHHDGEALEIIVLEKTGGLKTIHLGSVQEGFEAQALVEADQWFASRVSEGGSWSLAGCAVAPGFDFADFELADRKDLVENWPDHGKTIVSLTRVPDSGSD